MAFTQTTLDITSVEIFTADRTVAITALYLVNTSSSAVTVTVYLVPPAGSASSNRIVYSNLNCNSDETVAVLTERIVLTAGDSIWAECSSQFAVVATVASVAV
jgi:hypothetical protein